MSQLRKYISDPTHVIRPDTTQLKNNLTFDTIPIQIMDKKVKELRGRQIPLVKVMWNEANGDITWELEEKITNLYPYLFQK